MAARRKKRTDYLREESIPDGPEEESISEDSKTTPKRTLSLKNLKKTLSLRNLTLSLRTPRSFRTHNEICAAKNSFWLFRNSI